MTFVRNAWYVAGWSRNFGRDLTPLTIMEEDIVVFRSEAGEAVALTDECPHKRLPLSKGRLVGDVDYAGASEVAGAITPVPGGVGPKTIAVLLRNTLVAAYRNQGLELSGEAL